MTFEGVYVALLFAAGAGLGSFLNVVILRSVRGADITTTRSHCPGCRHTLTWYELIPVVSYLFLRGRCAKCGMEIAAQYPIVEGLIGIISVALFIPLPLTIETTIVRVLVLTAAALLVVLTVIDARTLILPDVFVVMLAVVAAVLAHIQSVPPPHLYWGVLIGGAFMFALWLGTRGRGIGFGDVKLTLVLGLLLGLTDVVILLFLAFIAGGLWGSVLLLTGRADMKTAVPFGPFLAGSGIAILLWPQLPEMLISLLWGV